MTLPKLVVSAGLIIAHIDLFVFICLSYKPLGDFTYSLPKDLIFWGKLGTITNETVETDAEVDLSTSRLRSTGN